MYNPYIVGRFVYLRQPTEQDAMGRWHEWLSDGNTTRFFNSAYWPNSQEDQLDYFHSLKGKRERLVLSIVDKATDTHIGVCSLSNIDWVSRNCQVALLIGEKAFRTGSHAVESLSLLLRIAFLRLNFRMVSGGHYASSSQTKGFMDLFRFREVGRFEDALWLDGRYDDHVIVMLRREDWLARNPNIEA